MTAARQSFEQLLFGMLLTLVFLLPIFWGSNRSWVWLSLASASFCMLAAISWLPAPARVGELFRRARMVLVALALWWLYGVVQVLPIPFYGTISVDPFASSLTVLQSSFYCALFILVLRLAWTVKRLQQLAGLMVVAGLLQACYGALMSLSGVDWLLFGPKQYNVGLATGTFVNRNHLAGFLEICLAIGVGLLVSQMRSGSGQASIKSFLRDSLSWVLSAKMGLRLALVIMVIALVLSHSRMGNTAFFVSLTIASGLALMLMNKPPRALLWLLVSLIVIDVVIVGTWFGMEQVVERLTATGQYNELADRYADKDRLDLSKETLAAWSDHRLLGSGGGTFEHLFPSYRPADLAKVFDHAHNDYLEILLEYGLLGTAPLVLFCVLAGASALVAQRRRRHPLMLGLGFASTMGTIAYLLHSAVDFNLHIPANAAYMIILLAMGVAARYLPSHLR